MKSTILLAIILLAAGCAAGQKRVFEAPESNFAAYHCIVVAPFHNMSRMGSGGLSMADAVANSLYAQGRFQVVERSEVQRYLRSAGENDQSVADTALAARIGRTLRADAVVMGTVNDYWYRSVDARPEISITLRVVDVQSEEVVLVTSRTYTPQLLRPGPRLLTAAADFVALDLMRPLVQHDTSSQSSRRVTCGYPVPGQLLTEAPAPFESPDLSDMDIAGPDDIEEPSPSLRLSSAVLQVINRLESSDRFQIEGLDFDLDEVTFRDEERANRLIENLGQALVSRPGIRIRIEAHSDGLGDADANRRLTQARAELLKRRLSSDFGIAPHRIEAEGMGGDNPLLPNINRRNREMNRRIEIIVLQGG